MDERYSTGQAAQLANTTEPRMAEAVRRGKVRPVPAIISGRRLWTRDQVLQAARALGLDVSLTAERLDAAAEVRSAGRPRPSARPAREVQP